MAASRQKYSKDSLLEELGLATLGNRLNAKDVISRRHKWPQMPRRLTLCMCGLNRAV